MSKDFQPNHFVPLVEFITKYAEKKKLPQQQKITDLFRSESVQKEEGKVSRRCLKAPFT
jgi:hypothetical protein